MADNKTKATAASAQSYVAAIDDDSRRKDCEGLTQLMTKATQHPPKMWARAWSASAAITTNTKAAGRETHA
jgi:hypothetical protein